MTKVLLCCCILHEQVGYQVVPLVLRNLSLGGEVALVAGPSSITEAATHSQPTLQAQTYAFNKSSHACETAPRGRWQGGQIASGK
jgi:hypothetical protein